jgi:hypothetical protein
MDWFEAHEALVWTIWVEINRQMRDAGASEAARAAVFWDHIHYDFGDLPSWLDENRPD